MAAIAQRRMILWTFALVLVLGALGGVSMLQPPSTLAHATRASGSHGRDPASVPLTMQEFAGGGAVSAAIDVALPCMKDGPKPTESTVLGDEVRQIRLSGENCLKNDEIASTEVRNEANGFSATVFQPTPKTFTTDYITLAKGSNRIRILHIYKRGARVEREYLVEVQNE